MKTKNPQTLQALIMINEEKLIEAVAEHARVACNDPQASRLHLLALNVTYWEKNLARTISEFLTLPDLLIEDVKLLSTELRTRFAQQILNETLRKL